MYGLQFFCIKLIITEIWDFVNCNLGFDFQRFFRIHNQITYLIGNTPLTYKIAAKQAKACSTRSSIGLVIK